MEITLHSNRTFFVLTSIICLAILTITLVCGLLFDFENFTTTQAIVLMCVFYCFFILILLIAIFKPKPTFIFNENSITIIKSKSKEVINISEVEKMEYYPFSWLSLLLIFIDVPYDDFLCITTKSGKTYNLGLIYLNDARELKQIYPNLIIYDKEYKKSQSKSKNKK